MSDAVGFVCLGAIASVLLSVGITLTDWEYWVIGIAGIVLWCLPGVDG